MLHKLQQNNTNQLHLASYSVGGNQKNNFFLIIKTTVESNLKKE